MQHPNILYIHTHDLGRYVQPYGHAVASPNIQRLAEEGVLFRQAYSAAPTCSPSRAALLTGQAPHNSGMTGLAHRGFSLTDRGQHIVHTLRRAGYTSSLCGVQHVAKDPAVIGYDRILSTKGSEAAAKAAEFLKTAPRGPFFLSVGFDATHREFPEPGPSEDPRYCRPPDPLPDTSETRRDMAGLKAGVRIVDKDVGVVLGALAASGLSDETLVICTTDHGIAFPGMKCTLTDHGLGVMLVIRGPHGFSGGRVCDALVSQIDLFPTICDILGMDRPRWLQGRSLLPLIRGETGQINSEIFGEVTYHAAYEPQRCVRTQRWKYIKRFGDRRAAVLPNCDDSLSKDVWLRHDWRDRESAAEQLYDLVFDPQEAHNAAGDPAMQGTLADMQNRLKAWMVRTDDPLLVGNVAVPAGAAVNDPAGLSPREEPRKY